MDRIAFRLGVHPAETRIALRVHNLLGRGWAATCWKCTKPLEDVILCCDRRVDRVLLGIDWSMNEYAVLIDFTKGSKVHKWQMRINK